MAKTITKQVNAEEYIDLDGNVIGTLDNLANSYKNVMLKLRVDGAIWEDGGEVDIKKINNSINNYKAINYCVYLNPDKLNRRVNEMAEKFPGFAKHIGYEPIKTN